MIFKYELKNLILRIYPIVIIVGITIFLYIYKFVIFSMYHSLSIDAVMSTQRLAMLGFLAISFLSFDFFSDFNKQGWKESVAVTKLGLMVTVVAKMVLLVGVVLLWFVNGLIVDFGLVWPLAEMPNLVRTNVFSALLLNYFLFPIVGIMLGFVAGILKRKFLGYILLVVFMLLTVGVLQSVNTLLFNVYGGKIDLDILARIFTLTQPNMEWSVDSLYLIPVEQYRYFLYLGWIILFVSIALIFLNNKKIILIVFSCVSIICFINVVFPGCIMNYNSNKNNVANDLATFQDAIEIDDKRCDFVKSYTMEVTVKKNLTATVEIDVKPGLEKYDFTLFNGYKIKSIVDEEGRSLEYDRIGDYVTVCAADNISKIVMTYTGYSGTFLSNSNLTILPGYFAWYPQEGFRQLFCENIVDSIYSYGYNKDISSLNDVVFNITFQGSEYPCFSNLESTENGFEGTEKIATIMSGPFETEFQDGILLCYPVLENYLQDAYVEDYKNALVEYQDKLGVRLVEDVPEEMFFLSGGFLMTDVDGTGYWIDDHAIQTTWDGADSAINRIKNTISVKGVKEILWIEVLNYAQGNNNGRVLSTEEFMNWQPESEVPDWPIENMYKTLIEHHDATEVNLAIIEYLQDEETSISCIDFLKELYVQLGGIE